MVAYDNVYEIFSKKVSEENHLKTNQVEFEAKLDSIFRHLLFLWIN